jgi:predicted dinucleotide-binding enzyme
MDIGILGTGTVGRTIGAKLAQLGHNVMIGTRDPARTLAQDSPDGMGNPPFEAWQQQHPQVRLGTFAEAAAFGAIVFNCTSGGASLDALALAGERSLNDKILLDIANPLDFSHGMPPSLSVCNTDSLGEQIQRAFPQVRVVKTLNTMTAAVMVNPALVPGDHAVFLSGNDAAAKTQVADMLKGWFGWQQVIDLGDITTARSVEMILPLWLSLWGALGTPMFNFSVARA